jgi:excisionase family DNA binding protein
MAVSLWGARQSFARFAWADRANGKRNTVRATNARLQRLPQRWGLCFAHNLCGKTKELAKLGGVNPSRIRQLLLAGRLKGEKFGRDWRIPRVEAERWLAGRK